MISFLIVETWVRIASEYLSESEKTQVVLSPEEIAQRKVELEKLWKPLDAIIEAEKAGSRKTAI